jgi:hypothetical protein
MKQIPAQRRPTRNNPERTGMSKEILIEHIKRLLLEHRKQRQVDRVHGELVRATNAELASVQTR